MQVVKSIVGQSIFQLGVMYALVYHSDAIFGVPNAGLMNGPSVHYTLVFNSFVLMQLFNQVSCHALHMTRCSMKEYAALVVGPLGCLA